MALVFSAFDSDREIIGDCVGINEQTCDNLGVVA